MEQKLVKFDFYLRLSASGSVETFKNYPSLGRGQRAVRMQLSVPASVFREPELTAKVAFDGEPKVADVVELSSRVEEILTGNGFTVSVIPAPEPELSHD